LLGEYQVAVCPSEVKNRVYATAEALSGRGGVAEWEEVGGARGGGAQRLPVGQVKVGYELDVMNAAQDVVTSNDCMSGK
jgi:hypothetical protein